MTWLVSLLFFFSIGLSGSDSPWFPWPNLAGVCGFILFARLLPRLEGKSR